jgi:hypothetical protein
VVGGEGVGIKYFGLIELCTPGGSSKENVLVLDRRGRQSVCIVLGRGLVRKKADGGGGKGELEGVVKTRRQVWGRAAGLRKMS